VAGGTSPAPRLGTAQKSTEETEQMIEPCTRGSRLATALLAITLSSLASAQSAGMAYISNQQGQVSVVELKSMSVVGTLDIGATGPRGLGITSDGQWLVTANKDDENISIVDTASGKLVRHVQIGKNPEFVRVVGTTAFVTYEPSGGSGPGPQPGGAARAKADDDDKIPGHIAVVDLKAGKVILDIVGKPETEGVEFSRDGRQLIVANESDNSLSVHDIATGELVKTVSLAKFGNRPRGIKLSPDGKFYVTTLEFSGKLVVLDDKLEPLSEIATGKFPYGVSFDRSGKRVFVAANRDQVLEVFDTKTWAKIKDIPIGERCWHFSFTPDDREILLACGKSNEVVVVDANTLEVTGRINGMKTPWGIVTYPKSMGSLDQP
jgi:YVTN family beta-propeller protein